MTTGRVTSIISSLIGAPSCSRNFLKSSIYCAFTPKMVSVSMQFIYRKGFTEVSSRHVDLFSIPLYPFKRTPRPNNWIAWEPSPLAKFINPIVDTRQLFHPSVNFREPISILTFDSLSLMLLNSEVETNSSLLLTIPFASQALIRLAVSPMFITPK